MTRTWTNDTDGGFWFLEASRLRSNAPTHRYAPLVRASLESMADFFRPLQLEVGASNSSRTNGFVLDCEQQPLPTVLEQLEHRLQPMDDRNIYDIDCQLAIHAYVQVSDQQHTVERRWLKLGDVLNFNANKDFPTPMVALSLNHTLLRPVIHHYYLDNRELYRLNQPLFEQALQNWEAALGEITEFEGPKKIYRYGFLPDDSPDEWTIEE